MEGEGLELHLSPRQREPAQGSSGVGWAGQEKGPVRSGAPGSPYMLVLAADSWALLS